MKNVSIGLVMVLAFLAVPQNLLAQTEPDPLDFAIQICNRIYRLDTLLVVVQWNSCLQAAGLTAGGLCVGCVIAAGPVAPACIIACIAVGLGAAFAIWRCWQTKLSEEDAARNRLSRCITEAIFGCV